MSALGHVLFLLPFSRDFACSGCIASFLTRSEARRQRKAVTGERKKGNFTCSQRIAVIHWVEATPFEATHFEATASRATHFEGHSLIVILGGAKASPICYWVASHQVPAMAHHRRMCRRLSRGAVVPLISRREISGRRHTPRHIRFTG